MVIGIILFTLIVVIIIFMSDAVIQKEGSLKPSTSPKDVFLHLLMIGSLYVSTFMFCSLWFDYVNLWFPDKLNFYYRAILEGVLVGTATLIVVFPVYLLASWLLEKEIVALPEKRELRVRKWLVYLTLFVSAIAIIVEVVRLVYNFLSGELTMNFFLKVFIVLAVAFAVFGYYLWDAKREVGSASKLPKYLAWGSGILVLGSIILSFFLVGSPAHQRAVRFDDQRVSDLQSVQSQVIFYWQQKEALPPALPNLADNISGFTVPVDPDTRAEYEYSVKGPLSFELCATFGAKSVDDYSTDRAYLSAPMMTEKGVKAETWDHEVGRTCFERTIDPDLYQTNKPLPVIIQEKEMSAIAQ